MDHTQNIRSRISFAYTKSNPSPSTSVAAAAPEPSTLAVKLSEDPEGHTHSEDHVVDNDSKQPYREDQHSLKDEDHNSEGQSHTIRRSRSGRLLRSTVQYDERSSRSSSPENPESQNSHGRRTRSTAHNQSEGDGHSTEHNSQDVSSRDKQHASENNIGDDNNTSRIDRGMNQDIQFGDNQDELTSDVDQEEEDEEVYAEEGDEANNEGSESVETNSSKNDDGGDSLIVSMYGSPSLVKVRSMFIDKLYKMVEDPSIQHLISWAKEGDMFYVYNCIELSSSILPKFFKHNNWQSFVRQLNMYGFHKIYRYDREESNMNRRNPETQRWQFYHPDFQRDQPHLRNNIKRKSARAVNLAQTFSRVVFERDKGYYVQQESATRFGVQPGHMRSHSSNHLQGSVPLYPPHPTAHRSPHDPHQRPAPIRPVPDYRSPSGQHPNDPSHLRDEKDPMGSKHHLHPSHHQHHYQGPPYQQQHSYGGGPHQRQHSYAGSSSQPHYSPEQGYAHKNQGYGSPRPLAHEPVQGHSLGGARIGNHPHGHMSGREPEYMEHDVKHGAVMSGGHFRSQSAPGLDPRRGDPVRGPHPFSQREATHSPPHQNSQQYYPREQHPSHPAPLHRHQGSFDDGNVKPPTGPDVGPPTGEGPSPPLRHSQPKHSLSPMDHSQSHPNMANHSQNTYPEQHRRTQSTVGGPGEHDDGGRRFTPPPPQGPPASHYQPPIDPTLPVESLPATPGMDPTLNGHDLVPRTVKSLEKRLKFVEDAYMTLRSYVQELQNIQSSQDQTISWMRDRMEQLTDPNSSRDVIMSPSLSYSGGVPSKRKAESNPGDQRDWSRRVPTEHHSQSYPREGMPPSGMPPSSPSQQPPGLPGQGPSNSAQGPGGRYEPSGFHPSFHPGHHSAQSSPHTPGSPNISSFISLLWRLTPGIPKRLFQVQHIRYDPDTVLNLQWNDERYTIDFEGQVLGQVKLKELREISKELTGVPLGGITLLYGGATMKDDNAPLSCFGIKAGAAIDIKGIKPTEEEIRKMTTSGDPEEYALVLKISGSLEKSKEFIAEYLPKYEADAEVYLSAKPVPFVMPSMPPARKRLHEQHGVMSENLLQALLALDGVTCKAEFEAARIKRREAVKETQKLLDVIDAINLRIKESDKAARL
ncbi:hypothetical protein BGZ76_010892 [Entomortierella beljakovae]|nr:hypothetical protein BGZ76_010892 [Entomortierella beljakovae]